MQLDSSKAAGIIVLIALGVLVALHKSFASVNVTIGS